MFEVRETFEVSEPNRFPRCSRWWRSALKGTQLLCKFHGFLNFLKKIAMPFRRRGTLRLDGPPSQPQAQPETLHANS